MDCCEIRVSDRPVCIFATLFACIYPRVALLDVAPRLEPPLLGDGSQLSETAQDAMQCVQSGPSPIAHRLFGQYKDFPRPALLEVAVKQQMVIDFHYIWEYEPTSADVQYINGQVMSVEYRLTTLRADESLTPAQHAVRLALFIFSQPFILVAKPNTAFCRAMTKRMKGWLEESELGSLWMPN